MEKRRWGGQIFLVRSEKPRRPGASFTSLNHVRSHQRRCQPLPSARPLMHHHTHPTRLHKRGGCTWAHKTPLRVVPFHGNSSRVQPCKTWRRKHVYWFNPSPDRPFPEDFPTVLLVAILCRILLPSLISLLLFPPVSCVTQFNSLSFSLITRAKLSCGEAH